MTTPLRSVVAANVAAALSLGAPSQASADASCFATGSRVLASEVSAAIAAYGPRVVAVGRVDMVSQEVGVDVLGIRVTPSATDYIQVGDYAVVIDWSQPGSSERILELRPLEARYVPGASEVFLKSELTGSDPLRANLLMGAVNIDYSGSAFLLARQGATNGKAFVVRGTQPHPNGVVLSSCIAAVRGFGLEGSLGTGRVEGSLGTGRVEGSLGTGRVEGSLGTGRVEGSLGTGKPDGSLGTGNAAE